jgi:hypothetical protein
MVITIYPIISKIYFKIEKGEKHTTGQSNSRTTPQSTPTSTHLLFPYLHQSS